ncbi:TIM barrel protein [Streptomyces sp. H10-C2]|uniref:TIM barrel protein n=1 Tax=unclassified Streptomyces TaxID=2593676 RepID=UPI0024BBA8A6|nr:MULTISPECIES: TIM barrel protein [unclassified Streptomyces]MDJ0340806.1 TIM barrel protein [Streptomyces sp. PH10-H1]MDJ0371646.1 TIM barrel protein [Streptomyces sp. H10-C2]
MRLDRVAAAPISWGVCEVPGWGHQLTPERVLDEMTGLGLAATEFGPDGFLPGPLLAARGMTAVGGFVPVVLHDPDTDPLAEVRAALAGFTAAGAGTLVLAAATGRDGYDARPELDALGWKTLLANLDRVASLASGAGITAALHPHVGTMVESQDDVERVLEGSWTGLCLDTGHLLVGGTDPVALARRAAGRVAHVHLKDVDEEAAAAVRDGRTTYTEAVSAGMYRPLGQGDIDIAALIGTLEDAGYEGWYVMEQDAVLAGEPPPGGGPVLDVRASLDWLAAL